MSSLNIGTCDSALTKLCSHTKRYERNYKEAKFIQNIEYNYSYWYFHEVENRYYRWRHLYGPVNLSKLKRLKNDLDFV